MTKIKSKGYLRNVVMRQFNFEYNIYTKKVSNKSLKIIGMIRERNEELLLEDTLNHIGDIVDGIVVFDDSSTDASVKIAMNHPKVIEVIVNKKWRQTNRVWEETANRKKLHDRTKRYKPEWLFYFDADERFEGDIRKYLLSEESKSINSIKISLFDAYITKNDKEPYRRGEKLYGFRNNFGIERRDIRMVWRNNCGADFLVPDAREPQIENKKEITKFYCQHYGKSLSIEHWDDTCRYYMEYFPKYSQKWGDRLGKAVHSESDFGTKLQSWDNVKKRSVKIN